MRAWLPDRQGAGVGKTIVRTALDWLLEQDVATLGLETMPRTVENIGFYARLGFFPGHLTVTLTNDIVTRGHQSPVLLSQRKSAASGLALEAGRDLVAALAPGYDFTREILLTAELGLGDTSLVDGDGRLDALVLWHSAPLAEGRHQRVQSAVADRKSTRLNSSHTVISYAVFCLKKKKKKS